ncbi:major allergen Pru ar 1-like [Eucalyptus grandis]|uniref:major allergen Pru ar 1-like n=1 Tax=Eucalyptus grandis TaxID=71139 RepID=UPI00192F109E|nr:major allergen Pru ar 1-like [Eucalyptus grandis]
MGVFSFTNEYVSTVPSARLFKALILDSHNLIPKLMTQAIKSIDIIQGNGGAGTIKQINIISGSRLISIKDRVDELNEETFTYKCSMMDRKEKFESIVHVVKLEPTPEGGSKNMIMTTYNTKGDAEFKEQDKASNKSVLEMYKLTEAYLLQNPDAYA